MTCIMLYALAITRGVQYWYQYMFTRGSKLAHIRPFGGRVTPIEASRRGGPGWQNRSSAQCARADVWGRRPRRVVTGTSNSVARPSALVRQLR